MDRHRSPTLLRRQLASELRRLREDTGMTSEQVSEHLCCTPSKISRIETASVHANPRDVRDMLDLYRVNGQLREDLLRLAQEARRKESWWRAYRDVPDVGVYIALEQAAASIRAYETLGIPGLLQVEGYARRITRAIFPDLDQHKVERLVELRMARQSLLDADDPPTLEVVVDEAAIHRLTGQRELMLEQLQRLVEAAGRPNVTFQLLPFSAGPHGGMAGPFTVLRFADQAHPDVVHLEHSTGDVYLQRADQVDRYSRRFALLQATALTPEKSVAFMLRLLR